MTKDVFISYSSKDRLAADAACAVLEAKGISCWIAPRDIPAGANWASTIAETIAQARVLLLIFSSNANASEQVQREVDVAANHRLSIIPFRIEDTLPQKSLEYFLNTRHWLDAFTPPLEQHLSKLADAIALILGGEVAATGANNLPPRRWAPREGRAFGPYFLGAAALLSVALVAFGWVAFHREAPGVSAAPPPSAGLALSTTRSASQPATIVYPRLLCASASDAAGIETKTCVTSALAAQHDAAGALNAYGPQNLFDGNPATAWCEGVPGPGNGQEITVAFSQAVIVSRIAIVNGYAKSDATFANNNSIHTLTAIWPDGTTSGLDLPDSREQQTIAIDHDRPVKGLRLRIESVNGGSKWPDTCLSELTFSLRQP